jgi:hypothetical protein
MCQLITYFALTQPALTLDPVPFFFVSFKQLLKGEPRAFLIRFFFLSLRTCCVKLPIKKKRRGMNRTGQERRNTAGQLAQ